MLTLAGSPPRSPGELAWQPAGSGGPCRYTQPRAEGRGGAGQSRPAVLCCRDAAVAADRRTDTAPLPLRDVPPSLGWGDCLEPCFCPPCPGQPSARGGRCAVLGTPGSPLAAPRRSLRLRFVPSLLLSPTALRVGGGSPPPPPAAPHPALGRSPLFLWAGGDGLVVPRQRGGPASPRGLQHRAAFAAPRGPPVPRSLWGLSASARPCWGSELLGAGRGRCGLAGQSTATQEPQSAIQRGEPGPPPCGAATRDCCGVRAEAPRDGPPPRPTGRPRTDVCPPHR